MRGDPGAVALAMLAALAFPAQAQESGATVKTLCQVEISAEEAQAGRAGGGRSETVGFLKRVDGQVKIFRGAPGAAEELDAEVGMDLYGRDAVVTGPNGGFDAIFTDNSTVSGVADTCFEISDYFYKPADEASAFRMRLGRGVVSISAGEVAKIRDDAMTIKIRNDTNLAVTGTRIVIRAK